MSPLLSLFPSATSLSPSLFLCRELIYLIAQPEKWKWWQYEGTRKGRPGSNAKERRPSPCVRRDTRTSGNLPTTDISSLLTRAVSDISTGDDNGKPAAIRN